MKQAKIGQHKQSSRDRKHNSIVKLSTLDFSARLVSCSKIFTESGLRAAFLFAYTKIYFRKTEGFCHSWAYKIEFFISKLGVIMNSLVNNKNRSQNKIYFTTANEEIFESVSHMSIDGVEVTDSYTFDDVSIDFPTLIIAFSSTVAVNVFSNWLYDQLKKHAGAKARINGQTIEKGAEAINVFINNSTNINVQITQKVNGENKSE